MGRPCPPLIVAGEEDLQSGVSRQQSGEDHGGGCVGLRAFRCWLCEGYTPATL